MKDNNQSNGLTLCQLIEQTGISKAHLASKMEMSYGTFKNKLNDSQAKYKFKPDEEEKLKEILRDYAELIQTVCGITFNKALSVIVNK